MRLYALCDQNLLDERGLSLDSFITIAKESGAEIIHYSNKTSEIPLIKKQLIKIRKNFDGFLIVNDVYELVGLCDGVHLGQEDLKAIDKDSAKAVKILRSVIGKDKILGVSTHNEAEVLALNALDVNYIGLGAYRDTKTKDVETLLGSQLDHIASKSTHFVAAIGGVQMDDVFEHVTYHVIGSGLVS